MSTVKNPRPNVSKTLATNLRQKIEAAGIGIRELERRSGVSNSMISRYLDPERESDPTLSTLVMLCEALECTVAEVIGEKASPLAKKVRVGA